MNRMAIFSDIHGNLPALKAVLTDIEHRDVDQVFCLGDLVDFAPWSNEVIDVIRHGHIPCIMGNHDQRIAFNEPVMRLQKHSEAEALARVAAISHTRNTMLPSHKQYLSSLPLELKLTYRMRGKDVKILLVHGSARGNDDYVYEHHEPEDLLRMMQDADTECMIMGHTHLSYIRLMDGGKWAINAGSVGRTKEGKAQATYLLLDVTQDALAPSLIKVDYPVQQTIDAILDSEIPDFYAEFLKG